MRSAIKNQKRLTELSWHHISLEYMSIERVQTIYGLSYFYSINDKHLKKQIWKRLNKVAKKEGLSLQDLTNCLTMINGALYYSRKSSSVLPNTPLLLNQAVEILKSGLKLEDVKTLFLSGVSFEKIMESRDIPSQWLINLYSEVQK